MSIFKNYKFLFFLCNSLLSNIVIAMQDLESENEKKGYVLTKSFIPRKASCKIPIEPFKESSIYKNNFFLMGKNKEKCCCSNKIINTCCYQWAFFGTQDYLDKKGYNNRFLICEKIEGACRIQCNLGKEELYLAINGTVSKNSYQWAFFATQEYLDNGKYISNFFIREEKDGSYRIQCNFGEKSYLAVNGTVSKNSYQWAFFATQEYLDNEEYTSNFFIDTFSIRDLSYK